MLKRIIVLIVLFLSVNFYAQTNEIDKNLIQFSGLLLSSDSIYPVPFASVSVLNKPYGTYSNLDGYFSFVAQKGDTIMFSHVEFKPSYFIIPDTLLESKYSVVKLMNQDTFHLPGVMIMPMPNRSTFDYAFVTKSIPDDDLARAKNNLERERLKEQAGNMGGSSSEAYKVMVQNHVMKTYYAGGQIPPMNIMNPFAWAQFFEAWSRGDYKKKSKPKPKK